MGNLDRWIGIAGLIVGVPGFITLFYQGHKALAVLTLVLLAVLLGSAWLIRRAGTMPPYCMKSVRVDLHLHDANGERATLKKAYKAVPSYAHLEEMTHRNIAADGAVLNLRWNDAPIPPEWIKTVVGDLNLNVRFPGPLPKGKEFDCSLSYDLEGSFLQSREAMIYVCDFPAKLVTIVIHFPQDRLSTTCNAFRVQGAGKKPIDGLVVDEASRTATLSLKRPIVGAEFEIWWDW